MPVFPSLHVCVHPGYDIPSISLNNKPSNPVSQVDVVVLSDHGMASISQDKVVLLDDFVTLDHARIYYGDVALIYPEAGMWRGGWVAEGRVFCWVERLLFRGLSDRIL